LAIKNNSGSSWLAALEIMASPAFYKCFTLPSCQTKNVALWHFADMLGLGSGARLTRKNHCARPFSGPLTLTGDRLQEW
jgi:hypothetical protein